MCIRDSALAQWLHSLDKLASYRCEYLLPGHTAAVIGSAQIQETLQNFRKAIDDILTSTLVGMNQGKSDVYKRQLLYCQFLR